MARRLIGIALAMLAFGAAARPHAAPEVELLVQTSPLAGFQYHAGRALWPLMQVGDPLVLLREPWNPYDAKAIRVEWRGVPIGYVPKSENRDLARLMDAGSRLAGRIAHLQRSRNPWQRVLFDVYLDRPGPEPATIPDSSKVKRPVPIRPPAP